MVSDKIRRKNDVSIFKQFAWIIWVFFLQLTLLRKVETVYFYYVLILLSTGTSDPYCRFKLGNEKYKSKSCKETLNPHWKEHFDLKFFADTDMVLEVSVYDRDIRKDEFMGR